LGALSIEELMSTAIKRQTSKTPRKMCYPFSEIFTTAVNQLMSYLINNKYNVLIDICCVHLELKDALLSKNIIDTLHTYRLPTWSQSIDGINDQYKKYKLEIILITC
jgi:hypothetical protein